MKVVVLPPMMEAATTPREENRNGKGEEEWEVVDGGSDDEDEEDEEGTEPLLTKQVDAPNEDMDQHGLLIWTDASAAVALTTEKRPLSEVFAMEIVPSGEIVLTAAQLTHVMQIARIRAADVVTLRVVYIPAKAAAVMKKPSFFLKAELATGPGSGFRLAANAFEGPSPSSYASSVPPPAKPPTEPFRLAVDTLPPV